MNIFVNGGAADTSKYIGRTPIQDFPKPPPAKPEPDAQDEYDYIRAFFLQYDRIPSQREIAKHFNYGQSLAERRMRKLTERGLIEKCGILYRFTRSK